MQSASSHGCLLRSLAYGMRGSALINIRKRELNCDVRVLFTIQLCIRVNEIIQSLAMLFGLSSRSRPTVNCTLFTSLAPKKYFFLFCCHASEMSRGNQPR